MEQLLEDYKRKLKTIIEMLNADTITPETIQRLTIKKGMIASFIVDIERAKADANTGDSGLHLQRVSQQRELLLAFKDWFNDTVDPYDRILNEDIDNFIESQ